MTKFYLSTLRESAILAGIPLPTNPLRDKKEQDEMIEFQLQADDSNTAIEMAARFVEQYPALKPGYWEVIQVTVTVIRDSTD